MLTCCKRALHESLQRPHESSGGKGQGIGWVSPERRLSSAVSQILRIREILFLEIVDKGVYLVLVLGGCEAALLECL